MQPQWQGQEAAGFPDNWNIGMSFYHNLFTREHNYIVDKFRELQMQTPDADSELRDPDNPKSVIAYKDVDDERVYQVARLVVAAEIAKIHTIEWTTQLLYNEPLYAAMNANWYGLFNQEEGRVSKVLRRILKKNENVLSQTSSKLAGKVSDSSDAKKATALIGVSFGATISTA